MKQCKCGSYAFNLYKEDIDQGDLCDVHYWRALAKPEQEPVGEAYLCDRCQTPFDGAYECPSCGHHTSTKEPVYTTPPQRTEQEPVAWADHGVVNWIADKQFKHASLLYTTPPQRTWVGLTDEEHNEIAIESGCMSADWVFYGAAVERKLKEKNT